MLILKLMKIYNIWDNWPNSRKISLIPQHEVNSGHVNMVQKVVNMELLVMTGICKEYTKDKPVRVSSSS